MILCSVALFSLCHTLYKKKSNKYIAMSESELYQSLETVTDERMLTVTRKWMTYLNTSTSAFFAQAT